MMKKHVLPALLAVLGCGALLWTAASVPTGGGDETRLPGGLIEEPADWGDLEDFEDEDVPLADLPFDATEEEREAAKREEFVAEVLRLVNEAREEAGVGALELDEALCTAAQTRAAECVGTFSHTRPNGTSYRTVLAEVDVTASWTGENLATGHGTPALVVSRWLQSDGHRANILNEKYNKIGIGLERNKGNGYKGYSWAQLFTE